MHLSLQFPISAAISQMQAVCPSYIVVWVGAGARPGDQQLVWLSLITHVYYEAPLSE